MCVGSKAAKVGERDAGLVLTWSECRLAWLAGKWVRREGPAASYNLLHGPVLCLDIHSGNAFAMPLLSQAYTEIFF